MTYIYSDEWKKLKPSDKILKTCHRVLISDNDIGGSGEAFMTVKKWCTDHCKSFVWMDITDVSDSSYIWDEIASFYFRDSRDAIIFTLKYKGGK